MGLRVKNSSSCQIDYDRKGSDKKKSMFVSLKGLGAKTNSLALNHRP
jgi:hypothetical protein